MKIWTSEYKFNTPWETVVKAAWRKYPNPITPSVLGTDIINREVKDNILCTHRLVVSKWGFPKWTKSLIGHANVCYASEHSEVHPTKKEMVLKTKNLTFCNFIAVDETVKYVQDPQDSSKTLLTQEVVITVQGVPLTSYMEDMVATKISANARKGRQAMEQVIQKLELKEFASSAVKSTDELLKDTVHAIDDLASKTRQSMDNLQGAAIKSLDEIQHNLSASPSSQSMPRI